MRKIIVRSVTVIITVVALAYLIFDTSLFKVKEAQAQCVRFKLVSCDGGGCSCGAGWTKKNEVLSGTSAGGKYLALCVSN